MMTLLLLPLLIIIDIAIIIDALLLLFSADIIDIDATLLPFDIATLLIIAG
jgi:hypothetical protein